jgi:AcrR family transcriptional regulator
MAHTRARSSAQPGAESGELRNKILQASVALIEEEGLARLSMREVARRAGVTHQAPYHYFPDREAILAEIATQGFRMLNSAVLEAVAAVPGSDVPLDRQCATARITALTRAYVEFACRHRAHFRIMFRPELVDMDNCPAARAQGGEAFQTVQRIVHEAVACGVPALPSESALRHLIWSVGHGLACLLLDGPLGHKQPNVPPSEHIEAVLGALAGLLEASLAHACSTPTP